MFSQKAEKPVSRTEQILSQSQAQTDAIAKWPEVRAAMIEIVSSNEAPEIIERHRVLLLGNGGQAQTIAEQVETMKKRLSAATKLEAAKDANADRAKAEAELEKLQDEMNAFMAKWQPKVDAAQMKINAADRRLSDAEMARTVLFQTVMDPEILQAETELRQQTGETAREIDYCQRVLSKVRRPDDVVPCPHASIAEIRSRVQDQFKKDQLRGKLKPGETIDSYLTFPEAEEVKRHQAQIDTHQARLSAARERLAELNRLQAELSERKLVP